MKDGNVIDVRTWNVASFELHLSDKLVDPSKPLTVRANGQEAYKGPFKEHLVVEIVKLPRSKFARTDEMPGGIGAQYQLSTYNKRGFLQVTGDAAGEAHQDRS